jgi:hypothetical protein
MVALNIANSLLNEPSPQPRDLLFFFLFLLLFIFYWIFILFTFQMFSPFQVSLSKTSYPIPPSPASMRVFSYLPTPIFPPWHSPTLGNRKPSGPRASPPTDVQQVHPLLHMWPAPWVPPCIFFGLWSSSQEIRWVWPVDTCCLHGAANPFSPFSNSFVQTPYSVQWLASSI